MLLRMWWLASRTLKLHTIIGICKTVDLILGKIAIDATATTFIEIVGLQFVRSEENRKYRATSPAATLLSHTIKTNGFEWR